MSSALGIAAVTGILKDLLDNRLVEQNITASIGDVSVTALPPDRISVGADERAQINLFLYRVTPHSGWRSLGEGNGKTTERLPLALDLHYLLTVYGSHDFQSELLLGCIVQLLHDYSVIHPDVIRASLGSVAKSASSRSQSPAHAALAKSSLAEQVEPITIAPEFLSSDDVSKLWSSLQAHYRLSVAYRVSPVLIQAQG